MQTWTKTSDYKYKYHQPAIKTRPSTCQIDFFVFSAYPMSVMDVLLIEVFTVSRISGKSSFCLVATVLGSKGGQALRIVFAFRLANCFTSGEFLVQVETSLKNWPPHPTSDYMKRCIAVTHFSSGLEVLRSDSVVLLLLSNQVTGAAIAGRAEFSVDRPWIGLDCAIQHC